MLMFFKSIKFICQNYFYPVNISKKIINNQYNIVKQIEKILYKIKKFKKKITVYN